MADCDALAKQLETCAFFHGYSAAEISGVLPCLAAELRSYAAGQIIWSEGSRTDRFGIIVSGSISIEGSDVWGRRVVVGHAARGQSFGEAYAALTGVTLLSDVIAREDTQVLFVSLARVLSLCEKNCALHADLRMRLVRSLAARNVAFARRLQDGAPRTMREKLLSYLSAQAKMANSASFDIPLTRQELANYLGVDRTSLSTVLTALQKEGLISTQRKHFELHHTVVFGKRD
ncbi:MAG: Crp/Fnr family transcriptional regulator [Atopobiaceae bacterium]